MLKIFSYSSVGILDSWNIACFSLLQTLFLNSFISFNYLVLKFDIKVIASSIIDASVFLLKESLECNYKDIKINTK